MEGEAQEEREGTWFVNYAMLVDAGPRSIPEAMKSTESQVWRTAISFKLPSREANDTFDFYSAKISKILISTRMILQKKCNEREKVECYKARLVEHEFRQRPGINFDRTSASLVSIPAVGLILVVLE